MWLQICLWGVPDISKTQKFGTFCRILSIAVSGVGMLIKKNSFTVCLLNTNGVPYALIFNKFPPFTNIKNTVSCMHKTMKCAAHDYIGFNLISRGF
jgi:hypothetical protein